MDSWMRVVVDEFVAGCLEHKMDSKMQALGIELIV